MKRESSIKILPEDLINKIAAGEVVERPASVVKELVENAIDAGAEKIRVEVQDAGRKMIRVSDDGRGMNKDEVRLALERHSTSKISVADDLFNIRTLGFRGEALPSIASVSRLEIRSRVKGEEAGTEAGSQLKIEGKKAGKVEAIGCPAGTSVSVKDLFFNTPARKKFLKSPMTEMGHIGHIVSKYAIANPRIAFELISDGKPLLSSPGSGKLIDAVMSVYGLDLARELIELNSDRQSRPKVSGFISRPTLSRIDRDYETFYVNRRYIRNFLLNRALEDAYRTLIPNHRYPVAVLFIEIDPKHIDVNVHPTKREIKFARTQEVMDAVSSAVKASLENQNIRVSEQEDQSIRTSEEQREKQSWKPEMAEVLFSAPSPQSPVPGDIELEVSAVQPLIPLYQHKETYIICTDGEDLVLIDQHAAHERVIYDQLSGQKAAAPNQNLLIPERMEFEARAKTTIQENTEYLRSLGFDLEEFGNNSFIMRSVPAVAVKAAPRQLLADIISEIQDQGRSARLEIKQENIRKLIACHSAIKAGDKLTAQEMNQLIKDLYATENPLTCPHGRPTMVRLSEEELSRRFGR